MTSSAPTPVWQDILFRDDAQAALKGWQGSDDDTKRQMLADALLARPKVSRIQQALGEQLDWPSGWMAYCAAQDEFCDINWPEVLARKQTLPGGENIMADLTASFPDLLLGREKVTADYWPGFDTLILLALDHDPEVGKQITNPHQFLHYAFHVQATDWLARSGTDIEALLDISIRQRRHLALIMPLHKDGQILPGKALDHWLDKNPVYRQTWERMVARDQALVAHEKHWYDLWLPSGQYVGSPLEAWCVATLGGGEWTDSSPFEHPTFKPPWEGGPPRLDHKGLAIKYSASAQNSMAAPLYTMMASTHEAVRREISRKTGRGGVEWGPHSSPIDPLGMALHYQQSWAIQFLETPEGARQGMALLDKDPRAVLACTNFTAERLAKVMIQEPSWWDWRDEQGNALLDLCLDRPGVRDEARRMTKTSIIKLGRLAPELLLDVRNGKPCLLDRLDVPDEVRAGVRRKALRKTVVQHDGIRQMPAGVRRAM